MNKHSRKPELSVAERQRREQAVNDSRASVALSGFRISPAEEVHAARFIKGEIDLAEFVKGRSDPARE